MNRRRMFQTLALAPVGVLLSQQEKLDAPPPGGGGISRVDAEEALAAFEFVRIGGMAYQNPEYRMQASLAFTLMLSALTPAHKAEMETMLRSDWSVLYKPEIQKLGTVLCNIVPVWEVVPSIQHRAAAIDLLNRVGIDGFLGMVPGFLEAKAPPVKTCGGGPYEDGFYAGIGLIGTSLGVATMLGCGPCGPIAMGMGVAAALLKAVRFLSCL